MSVTRRSHRAALPFRLVAVLLPGLLPTVLMAQSQQPAQEPVRNVPARDVRPLPPPPEPRHAPAVLPAAERAAARDRHPAPARSTGEPVLRRRKP